MSRKVHLLDYVAGNIRSLVNAIERCGYEVEWVKSPDDVKNAEVRERGFFGAGSSCSHWPNLRPVWWPLLRSHMCLLLFIGYYVFIFDSLIGEFLTQKSSIFAPNRQNQSCIFPDCYGCFALFLYWENKSIQDKLLSLTSLF